MPERNELITVCRQIGGMMEAGVDILRITRVLRAQTNTPRLLQLYDSLDRDLTMGRSLAEAMSRAPDVFSPFAVQMIQQGEARNDLAGAFLKVADFLKQELEEDAALRDTVARNTVDRDAVDRDAVDRDAVDRESSTREDNSEAAQNLQVPPSDLSPTRAATPSPLTVIALDGLMDRLQTFMLRALTIMSGLMLSLASVWWLLELGYIEKRWELPLAFSMTAVFLGGSGIFIQRRIRADRRREARCSFCGKQGIDLQRAPRFAGAAICSRCAAIVAKNSVSTTSQNPEIETLERHNPAKLRHGNPDDVAANSAFQTETDSTANGVSSEKNATTPKATDEATTDEATTPKATTDDSVHQSVRETGDLTGAINPEANSAAESGSSATTAAAMNGNRKSPSGVKTVVDEEDYE